MADEVLRQAVFVGSPKVGIRLFTRRPDVAELDLCTAVAAGRIGKVRAILAADPAAASRKGGPLDWEPLLYLAYMRLPGAEAHAVEIARLLLDHGADPNAGWSDGRANMSSPQPAPPFKVLTGVIGEGEGGYSGDPTQRPHPCADALAALLLERGADHLDLEALYDTAIRQDETKWLDVLWARAEALGETGRWRAVSETRIAGDTSMSPLDWLLGMAVAYRHIRRAAWALAHGASARGVSPYGGRPVVEGPQAAGDAEMVELLVRHGAEAEPLGEEAALRAACARLDRDAVRAMLDRRPGAREDAGMLLDAAALGRADVVEMLLDLGLHADLVDASGVRALQSAIRGRKALDVVKLLVARGAGVDAPTRPPLPDTPAIWYGGAMGFAAYFEAREIAAWLAPLSRDVWPMTTLGLRDRLAELFAGEPGLASAVHPKRGHTPLHALPDDEEAAAEMADFLLAHGADPTIRNRDGLTPEELARKRGLYDAADVIADAASR